MKLSLLAAGALLVGTSAIAWVPLSDQQVSSATEATQPLPPAQVPSSEIVPPAVTAATAPVETASIAPADFTPRPATMNYPPCSRTVTDNCIQLHERGVRTALNGWTQPTGGLAGRTAAPVQTAMTDTSEASEVLATPDATTPVTTADASSALPAPTDVSQYQGMGGPEENMQTGYPPCSRTVTDRCIQLYERGVTGRGN